MFRPRALAGGKTKAGKLSSNIRKDNYKPESGKESVINGDGKLLKNPTDAKPASSGNAPKRRMTFGGLRSDKRGEIYKSQRRPSFMATLGNRAVKVAEAATKATRRLSITGNNGRGFELVAIGVSLQELSPKGRIGLQRKATNRKYAWTLILHATSSSLYCYLMSNFCCKRYINIHSIVSFGVFLRNGISAGSQN